MNTADLKDFPELKNDATYAYLQADNLTEGVELKGESVLVSHERP